MSLSKLNHDCFLSVLNLIPLTKQLPLRLVSTAWCATIESRLCLRKSLALIQPTMFPDYPRIPSINFYHYSDYLPLTISNLTFPLLLRLFPSVEKLFCWAMDDQFDHELSPFANYIRALSPSLSSLAIYHYGYIDWRPLAGLSNLKRFYSFKTPNDPSIAKVIGRFHYFATSQVTARTLQYIGANLRWLHIDHLLCYEHNDPETLEKTLHQLPEQTKASLEHLSIGTIGSGLANVKPTILQAFCSTFLNLKSFQLLDSSISFETLACQVSRLRNLRQLTVQKRTLEKAAKGGFDANKWANDTSIKIIGINK